MATPRKGRYSKILLPPPRSQRIHTANLGRPGPSGKEEGPLSKRRISRTLNKKKRRKLELIEDARVLSLDRVDTSTRSYLWNPRDRSREDIVAPIFPFSFFFLSRKIYRRFSDPFPSGIV